MHETASTDAVKQGWQKLPAGKPLTEWWFHIFMNIHRQSVFHCNMRIFTTRSYRCVSVKSIVFVWMAWWRSHSGPQWQANIAIVCQPQVFINDINRAPLSLRNTAITKVAILPYSIGLPPIAEHGHHMAFWWRLGFRQLRPLFGGKNRENPTRFTRFYAEIPILKSMATTIRSNTACSRDNKRPLKSIRMAFLYKLCQGEFGGMGISLCYDDSYRVLIPNSKSR